MNWEHPRNTTDVERKQNEAKAGTDSSFIAAMVPAA